MKKKFWNKKILVMVSVILAALAVLTGGLYLLLSQTGSTQTYTGYLVCQNCGIQGKCVANNTDLTTHPELYTLKCAKMADCIASGYGMCIKQSNGKYKFVPFDANGSLKALDNIIFSTKRADNLLVEVKGTMSGNMIMVSSIAQK